MTEIRLKKISNQELHTIWQVGFTQDMPEWAQYNGPYFEAYQSYPNFQTFLSSKDAAYLLNEEKVRAILLDNIPIGMVSRYWEDEKTLWLEIGVIIYDAKYWNKGIAYNALIQWINQTFYDFPELEHIGLTTWSGNPGMMRLAEKLGMKQEACIRKVRYWQGVYYDSVKYGVLRQEWYKN
ncbi:GNAT family N-acetyltransferase [Facklamia miroungae]|uniref:Acetyltransferase (GNAT) domain-containing protein n=1 Tax=Facklamia miroungae TaxID=120956 RepID=A0A1G7UP25_9LACT|nr:GNAT family protein [Facklamia miroungae]NKZ30179.1 GNAT family N-acetyltransferase [Facklamia miroungae]SDG49263.1 Acetyltransferase (GNAT) domain-containing protein [Facklamia miroungae]